jgi:hypothetical protein
MRSYFEKNLITKNWAGGVAKVKALSPSPRTPKTNNQTNKKKKPEVAVRNWTSKLSYLGG